VKITIEWVWTGDGLVLSPETFEDASLVHGGVMVHDTGEHRPHVARVIPWHRIAEARVELPQESGAEVVRGAFEREG
jgi:hypothetical protein